ncbi:MAG: hypothetical protein GY816_08590 [Cytophagales bacterium]|nr:hypothetical protein [Cytophagales bacterium]
MTRYLMVLLVVLMPWFANSSARTEYQVQSETDSLLKVLAESAEDSNKVYILYKLGWKKLFSQPDTAQILLIQALNLAQDLGFKEGIAKSNNHLGIYHAIKGTYDSAIFFTSQCLRIYEELNDGSGWGIPIPIWKSSTKEWEIIENQWNSI